MSCFRTFWVIFSAHLLNDWKLLCPGRSWRYVNQWLCHIGTIVVFSSKVSTFKSTTKMHQNQPQGHSFTIINIAVLFLGKDFLFLHLTVFVLLVVLLENLASIQRIKFFSNHFRHFTINIWRCFAWPVDGVLASIFHYYHYPSCSYYYYYCYSRCYCCARKSIHFQQQTTTRNVETSTSVAVQTFYHSTNTMIWSLSFLLYSFIALFFYFNFIFYFCL